MLRLYVLALLLLVASVFCAEYRFWRDPVSIRDCISSYLNSPTDVTSELKSKFVSLDQLLQNLFSKLSNMAVDRFHNSESFYTEEDIRRIVQDSFIPEVSALRIDELKDESNEVWLRLGTLTANAVMACADDIIFVPMFPGESVNLAQFLNLMLVSWSRPLNELADSEEGRWRLQQFASNALLSLNFELSFSRSTIDDFRSTIFLAWMQRANGHFDIRRTNYPFIPYYYDPRFLPEYAVCSDYSTDIPTVRQIIANPETKMDVANWDRNPPARPEERNRLLKIYHSFMVSPEEVVTGCLFDNIFLLRAPGLTSAELYYLRFYDMNIRILFLHREMSVIDLFWPSIPIPNQLLRILTDDSAWSEYLMEQRRLYLQLGFQPEGVQVSVEDLFNCPNFFWGKASYFETTTLTATNSTITTESSITSSTTDKTQGTKRKNQDSDSGYGCSFCGKCIGQQNSDDLNRPGPSGTQGQCSKRSLLRYYSMKAMWPTKQIMSTPKNVLQVFDETVIFGRLLTSLVAPFAESYQKRPIHGINTLKTWQFI